MAELSPDSRQPGELGPTVQAGKLTGRYSPGRVMFAGRYRLVREIGSGGMGVVWLAEDIATGEKRALKLFTPEFLRAKGNQAEAEAEMGQRLDHENIVRTHGFMLGEEEGAIVMDYVDGENLWHLPDRERRKCYDPPEVLPWTEQICAALHYAHTRKPEKVIHRDVKPQNILRDKATGTVKLGDFGISRVVQETILATRGTLLPQDQAALGAYTIGFASPEQVNKISPGRVADDVFSVGATLYWLLTGTECYTFEADAPNAAFTTVSQRRRMRELDATKIPKHWDRTIAACLAPNPDQRPKSVADIPLMLVGKLQPPKMPTRPTNTPKGVLAALALVAIVLSGVAAWFFLGAQETGRVNGLLQRVDAAREEGDALAAHELLQPESALLAKHYTLKREWNALQNQDFDWKVAVSPPDASVIFPGDATAKLENGVVKGLKIGRHPVMISHPGYRTESFDLPVGGREGLRDRVELERLRGTLRVDFAPADPAVSWTVRTEKAEAPGDPVERTGKAPETLTELPSGRYAITIRRPGWPDFTRSLDVGAERMAEARHIFQEAVLTVMSRQAGAEISFQPVGTGAEPVPLGVIGSTGGEARSRPIPTGTYQVIGRLRDYPEQTRTVSLEETSPPVEFNWSLGRIRLSANLPGAEIFEDGKSLGRLEDLAQPLERVSGPRTFRAEVAGLVAVDLRVEVREDEVIEAPPFHFAFSRVTFEGGPGEAEVYEGTRRLGRGLPLTLPVRRAGDRVVFRVEAAGYEPREMEVATLTGGEVSLPVNLTRIPEGWVTVSDLPKGAEVVLREVGSNRELERAVVMAGGDWKSKAYRPPLQVRVEARHGGHAPADSGILAVNAGSGANWIPAMKPNAYKYRFLTEPTGVLVSVNGSVKGTTGDDGVYESEWVKDAPKVTYTLSKSGYIPAAVTLEGAIGEVAVPVVPVDVPRPGRITNPAILEALEGPRVAPKVMLERKKESFTNSLGMKFVSVPGTDILMSIWETRVRDYAAYAKANPGVSMEWRGEDVERRLQGPDYPVVNVSVKDANAFCLWLSRKDGRNYRLPSYQEICAADRELPVRITEDLEVLYIPRTRPSPPQKEVVKALNYSPENSVPIPDNGQGNTDSERTSNFQDYLPELAHLGSGERTGGTGDKATIDLQNYLPESSLHKSGDRPGKTRKEVETGMGYNRVGEGKANFFGIFDLEENVQEWSQSDWLLPELEGCRWFGFRCVIDLNESPK